MSAPEPAVWRSLRGVLRYVLGIAAGAVVLLLVAGKRGDLTAAGHELSHIDAAWLAAAVAAEAASLWLYAYLQHRVLRLAGAAGLVGLPPLMLLALANSAMVDSVPTGPVVPTVYRFRFYRQHEVSGAAAGWTVFTVWIGQITGMSVLTLLGVVVALAGATGAAAAGITVAGLLIVAVALALLIRRDLLMRLAGAAVRGVRRVTGHPRASLSARIDSALARMREIPLSGRSAAGLVVVGTGIWSFDFGCLVCAFGAVHAPVPWYGVLLAYGAAQVAGTLPVVPGGLGIVEGSLAVILAAYGAGRAPAVAVALAYRLVSYWLAIAAGWASFGVIECQARRRAAAALTPPAPPSGAPAASPPFPSPPAPATPTGLTRP